MKKRRIWIRVSIIILIILLLLVSIVAYIGAYLKKHTKDVDEGGMTLVDDDYYVSKLCYR